MALSIMYGENCFHLLSCCWAIEDGSYRDRYGLDSVSVEYSWEHLKNVPCTRFSDIVSPIDCLDTISQTSSGQTFLKHLQISFGRVASMRAMDGVLLRILKRMQGLQSVELDILRDWEDLDLDKEDPFDGSLEATEFWNERKARDFLLLFREELSHIKKITVSQRAYDSFDDTTIIDWMADELEKRNKAWAPPLPSYKNFRRTLSPMSIMDADFAKSVVEFDDKYRSKDRLRGVF